jgi:hypothetical protein
MEISSWYGYFLGDETIRDKILSRLDVSECRVLIERGIEKSIIDTASPKCMAWLVAVRLSNG